MPNPTNVGSTRNNAKEREKKENNINKISPLCPLSCWLGHRQIFIHRLHIAEAIHNCGISSRSGVHPPGYAPCIPPHNLSPFTPILYHSPCLPDIQTSFP